MSDDRPQRDRVHERTRNNTGETEHQSESVRESDGNPAEQTVCPECDSSVSADPSTGERTCDECGLVVSEDAIDPGPEWRAFNNQEQNQKSRVGPARTELRHDRGMSTTIDWKDKDAYGNQLSAAKRAQMQRLRTWNERVNQSGSSHGLSYANGEIMRMGSALGVPEAAQETAASLYRQCQDNELIPGRSIEAMATATLYIALRVHEEPRSLDEMASVSRVARKPVSRAHRYICQELDIPLKPTNPIKYVPRFGNGIGVEQDIIRTAEGLIKEIDGRHMSGCDPTVLAGSALYAAAIIHGELITQHSVRDAADITEVSIRNNYKRFLIHTDAVDIDEETIEGTNSPIGICREIHGEVEYNDDTKRN